MLSDKGLPEEEMYLFCANLRGTTFEVENIAVESSSGQIMLVEISVLSKRCDVDPNQVIGNTATLNIVQQKELLPYGGIVTGFKNEGSFGGITRYKISLTLRGWLKCA
ncbi:MAG: hypothetical protein GX640_22975 [Fibrobacter sp.]|nr:hypothetical protein [Fibrobacter sp.]